MRNLLLLIVMWSSSTIAAATCQVSEEGINLVKYYEGFAPQAYRDSGGGWWAIGYGSNGPGIGKKTVWTEQQAHQRLRRDLHFLGLELCQKLKEKGIEPTANQFNALLSFAYNAGIGSATGRLLLFFMGSSKFVRASNRILLYVKVRGKVAPGLVRRRNAERNLFLKREDGDMFNRANY